MTRRSGTNLTVLSNHMLSAEEFRELQVLRMSEKQLQDSVLALADRLGYLVYHTYDSRRSRSGYPDLHLVRIARPGRPAASFFRELKTEKGRVSATQIEWLDALKASGVDAGVWRPSDWTTQTILRELENGGALDGTRTSD